MQQYTRLVLLAVEVVAAAGLPTARPLRPPETIRQPSGYSAAFTTSCSVPLNMLPGAGRDGGEGAAGQGQGRGQLGPGECPPRGLAVRLMMAFTGAVLGSEWSLKKFVEGVRVAYAQVRGCSRKGSRQSFRPTYEHSWLLAMHDVGEGQGKGAGRWYPCEGFGLLSSHATCQGGAVTKAGG